MRSIKKIQIFSKLEFFLISNFLEGGISNQIVVDLLCFQVGNGIFQHTRGFFQFHCGKVALHKSGE